MELDTNYLKKKLKECRKINISDVSLADVDDIDEIVIDKRRSSEERIIDFLINVKNPYIFKSNGKLVQICFSDSNKTAEECLTNVLKNLYK